MRNGWLLFQSVESVPTRRLQHMKKEKSHSDNHCTITLNAWAKVLDRLVTARAQLHLIFKKENGWKVYIKVNYKFSSIIN